ncbi:MAG TPA: response regulator [Steroidobacteraceae bacterium]|nr:response regulator [Steroidobacteraceae bacterium]
MPLRILYVEDNPLVREVTSELLSQDAREVIARSTAEEALTEFKLQSFDVVITDISLPVMSGLDLARALLALQPRVPIILASGYALTSVVQNLGPNVRTIVKPFEAAEIDSLITDLCAVRDDAARDDHAHDAA